MLLVLSFLFPIAAGIVLASLPMEKRTRHILFVLALLVTDLLSVLAVRSGKPVTLVTFSDRVSLSFAIDGLGTWILAAVLILYTAVCFYGFEYMQMEEREELFYAFFFISFGALIAVCMSANLVTLYLSFEFLTLTTFPLVLHERTKDAISAGLKYLFYSIGGALMGLLAVFFVYSFSSGDAAFVPGGFLDPAKIAGRESILLAVVMVGIIGFGTKAGLYPMHGWLPAAHPIAPAPASALLSGIVAKAGVLSIIRLVYYSVGADHIRGTWVQTAWMTLCLLTIFMGSMMAFREKVMKKRLAYSTISQISYILLGLSFLSDDGLRGGMLHLMSHMAAKGCLFLVAGVFIYRLGIRNVADLKGIGRKMPLVLACFAVASLSLVGIPPLGGFLSKWVIAGAAIENAPGAYAIIAPVVLLISALLTAGYLLPVVVNGFFPGKDYPEEVEKCEPTALMTVPLIVLCAVAFVMGVWGISLANMAGL